MGNRIKSAFNVEISKGIELFEKENFRESLHYFERAHILGQQFVREHTVSHLWMLRVAFRSNEVREIIGQLIRIPAGIIASSFGVIPLGNTGSSNVSLMKPMKIPEDLKDILEAK